MKKKQIRNLFTAIALVAVLGTGTTMAFLSAETETVTNTFAVGKNIEASDLLLNEAALLEDNRTADTTAERVTELGFVDIMQGEEMAKDPTVQVAPDLAECYMFVKVEGLDALSTKGMTVDWSRNWKKADGKNTLDGYYYYAGTGTTNNVLNPASELLQDEKGINKKDGKGFMDLDALFTKVTVSDDASIYGAENIGTITAKACAVQARGFKTVEAVYKELPSGF